MKYILCLPALLILSIPSYSQNNDLIVKINGDSIACQIDSISEMQIYFEMRFNHKKAHTYVQKSDVREYKYNALNKKNLTFEPGTSILRSDSISHELIGKNALYGSLGFFGVWAVINANYERILYYNSSKFINSVWFRFGGGAWASWGVSGSHAVTGITLLTGKGNNHIEANAGLTLLYDKASYEGGVSDANYFNETEPSRSEYMTFNPAGGLGYRYSKPKGGFIFRIGLSFPESAYLSLGFRF